MHNGPSHILMSEQTTVSVNIDCSAPLADNFFEMSQFVEYMQKIMKVSGLRNNMKDKITIEAQEKKLVVTASVKYTKRAIRYYARKFLKKVDLRDRFRLISNGKDSYEFRAYNVTKDE